MLIIKLDQRLRSKMHLPFDITFASYRLIPGEDHTSTSQLMQVGSYGLLAEAPH